MTKEKGEGNKTQGRERKLSGVVGSRELRVRRLIKREEGDKKREVENDSEKMREM